MSFELELMDLIEAHFEQWARPPEEIVMGFWPWRDLLDAVWPKLTKEDVWSANFGRLELCGVPIRHVETLGVEQVLVIR